MNRFFAATARRFAVLALASLAFAGTAQAQATRTWVSGVGDDVNPCSRTAPCKTYAGAISKTARGGIISTLDPGGFGTVTITKSITIEGTGTNGSILAAGAPTGVTINITDPADTAKSVVLKDLGIDGAGTGTNGIRMVAGNSLVVDNVRIRDVTTNGIDITSSSNARVVVRDTLISRALGTGIRVQPTGSASVNLEVERTTVVGGQRGLQAWSNGDVTVRDSLVTGHSVAAVEVVGVGPASASALVTNSTVSNSGNGLVANGALATIMIGNVVVTGNGLGLWPSGGLIQSFQTNQATGNATDGLPSSNVLPR